MSGLLLGDKVGSDILGDFQGEISPVEDKNEAN